MIDTHSHIDGEEFAEDLDATIARAKAEGIEKIFVPAICMKDMQRLINVCEQYPHYLYPMVGLHPENIMDEDYHKVLDTMEQILARSLTDAQAPQFIAVGEVGLDLYWDDTYRNEQMEAFERQIEWAVKYQLPLMIHVRKAHNELMALMKKYRNENLTGVFHCFTGSEEMARDLLSFPGFCLGIGGVLTFKKAKLPEVIRNAVPLDRIVLETDAPYMAPVPFRGKRNESMYVKEVAKTLAGIFETTIEQVDSKTTENALKIFKKALN